LAYSIRYPVRSSTDIPRRDKSVEQVMSDIAHEVRDVVQGHVCGIGIELYEVCDPFAALYIEILVTHDANY
jgi:hypothetical protein